MPVQSTDIYTKDHTTGNLSHGLISTQYLKKYSKCARWSHRGSMRTGNITFNTFNPIRVTNMCSRLGTVLKLPQTKEVTPQATLKPTPALKVAKTSKEETCALLRFSCKSPSDPSNIWETVSSLTPKNKDTLDENQPANNQNQKSSPVKIINRQFQCSGCSQAYFDKWRLEQHVMQLHRSLIKLLNFSLNIQSNLLYC